MYGLLGTWASEPSHPLSGHTHMHSPLPLTLPPHLLSKQVLEAAEGMAQDLRGAVEYLLVAQGGEPGSGVLADKVGC
jgi:hypothetical protein